MAVYEGYFFDNVVYNPPVSDNLTKPPIGLFDTTPKIAFLQGTPEAIPRVYVYGLSPQIHRHAAGAYHLSYKDLYYNRMHVVPSVINAGTVLFNRTFQLEIYNAFLDGDVALQSSTLSNCAGITNNVSTSVYHATQSKFYVATVTTQGPPVINGTFTFTFDRYSDLNIKVKGNRVIMFSVPIDWEAGITEQLEYLTNILTAYSSKEQRIQCRNAPRRKLIYKVQAMSEYEASVLDALLWGWQAKTFVVPEWMDVIKLTADSTAGTSVIYTEDTAYRKFEADRFIVLFQGTDNYEITQLISVNDNSLILRYPLAKQWPAGTLVIPLSYMKIMTDVDIKQPTIDSAIASVTFEEEVYRP